MKNLFFSLFAILLLASAPVNRYRGDIKILIDPDGLTTYDKSAETTTVSDLTAIERPANSELGKNRSDPEKRKVTVTALLIGIGHEPDGDYHLIICSLNKKDSMIAEIPDPTVKKLKGFPGLRDDFTTARSFIENNVDETPGKIHYLENSVKVKITGVPFFDRIAHGSGRSTTGIEIHPVLKIRKA